MVHVTKLEPNQVYVFGSNAQGFHGAGTAGYAMRGDYRNNWRTDDRFIKAINAPIGSHDRLGKWATLGISRGWQKGTEGMSYAIQTVIRPGERLSVSIEDIEQQFHELAEFAIAHKEWVFIMNPVGTSYAGHSSKNLGKIFKNVLEIHGNPANIVNVDCYDEL